MFRKGMAFVSLNGVDCNTMTRKELIDTIIASDNMDLVMQDNMSEFSEDAKPSYDAHGGAAVFVGGGMGESTVDAGVKFTYIMPPSNAQMLATYFATRPKIVFVLSRPDTATSWGLEFTKALPLTVKHVSDVCQSACIHHTCNVRFVVDAGNTIAIILSLCFSCSTDCRTNTNVDNLVFPRGVGGVLV